MAGKKVGNYKKKGKKVYKKKSYTKKKGKFIKHKKTDSNSFALARLRASIKNKQIELRKQINQVMDKDFILAVNEFKNKK